MVSSSLLSLDYRTVLCLWRMDLPRKALRLALWVISANCLTLGFSVKQLYFSWVVREVAEIDCEAFVKFRMDFPDE